MAALTLKNNRFMVTGDLHFESVCEILSMSHPLISDAPSLIFDLSGVGACNSAALALLLEWKKIARHQKKTIQFLNVPNQLKQIAAVSELEAFL